jgi:hypothetical protein
MTTVKALLTDPLPGKRSLVVAGMMLGVLTSPETLGSSKLGGAKIVVSARSESGAPGVLTGLHRHALATTLVFDKRNPVGGDLADATVELSSGFVGDRRTTPRCAYWVFIEQESSPGRAWCPNGSAVGIAKTYLAGHGGEELRTMTSVVYSLAPAPGVVAEFGFVTTGHTPVLLEAARPGSTTVSYVSRVAIPAASAPAATTSSLSRGSCERSRLNGAASPRACTDRRVTR